MPDVLLTHAYFLAQDPHEQELMRPFPPLGLQSLVAWLRQQGEACDWWDATFHPGPAAFAGILADADPRLVGFYGHTVTRRAAGEMIRMAEGRRIVAGGPDPVQYLEAWFELGAEVVVIGEGELTLQELVAHLRAHHWRWEPNELARIPGIAYRVEGRIVRTPPRPLIRPLDRLPWPAREPRDLDQYLRAWKGRHGETALSLASSRGCPYHCSWCSKQVFGDSFRRRSVAGVVEEVEQLRDRWAPDQLWFVDDMFTINRRWVEDFCQTMIERRVGMPWYVIGRAETLDAALVARMREAGLRRMFLSAESGADHVLDAMKKGTSVAEIERAAGLLHEAGVELGVFVMLGYPGEEKADILATRDMLRRIRPEVTLLSVAHPMKGTAFYDEVRDRIHGESGGRLRFHMRYAPRVYDAAQRMIWAELGARERWRAGDWLGAARAALRYPAWRAAFELSSRAEDLGARPVGPGAAGDGAGASAGP